ncbi:hypothetical protein SDC9_177614 [bioreactor metagenome]|uniref:Uncharacterized protein n=1 Tax=bioreactor metagenome TaxID=1076179 RepID=A0A645GV71_9ZZZZ
MEERVDIIRPALERGDGHAAPYEGAQQPERQRGFAAPGIGSRNQKARNGVTCRIHLSPGIPGDSRNGRP